MAPAERLRRQLRPRGRGGRRARATGSSASGSSIWSASLVDKSILTMVRGGRRGRYRLLETLRQYGAQRLAEAGEEAELGRAARRVVRRALLGRRSPVVGASGQREGFEVLDVEWANVEAALDFLTASAPEAEMGLRMAADLWLYWLAARPLPGRHRPPRGAPGDRAAPSPTRAMALWALGFLVQATGDHAPPRALSALEEARRVCDGDRRGSGAGLRLARARARPSAPGNRGAGGASWSPRGAELMLRADDAIGLSMGLYLLATVATAGRSPTRGAWPTRRCRPASGPADTMIRGTLERAAGDVEWLLGDGRRRRRG